MFEQSLKNIDDILHQDSGCATELDYIEQTSWILFLKYLDDLEKINRLTRHLLGRSMSLLSTHHIVGMHGRCQRLQTAKQIVALFFPVLT